MRSEHRHHVVILTFNADRKVKKKSAMFASPFIRISLMPLQSESGSSTASWLIFHVFVDAGVVTAERQMEFVLIMK
jgi:hypothetical protein